MSKSQINTKSRDYMKDKEAFLRELKQFNDSKNIPFKIPLVNDVDIDLFLFYTLVLQRGGLSKVNQTDAWDSFLRPLRLPHPCINGSTLLRRIYGTYLEKFERAKGPPGRDDDNDMDDDPRSRRGGFPRVSYSGAYISGKASGEQLKTGARPIAGPSERLALSLLSPMPNEQDFAVNVCTVLAADYSNRLPITSTPHILDFLLAHAGVYNHSSLRDTIGRSYYESRGMYPDEFWRLRAGGGGARELADETKFMVTGFEQPDLMVQAMASQNNLTDHLMNEKEYQDVIEKVIEEDIHEDWVTEPTDEDQLFAPDLPGGAKCVYTQRVLQIASIVRSLSFHEENIQHLSRNTTLIRFLLLCANCWVGTLRQSGLDTLGNVCSELVVKEPATCLISRHVLSTVQAALAAADRARVLAALEVLNKLAQNEANEEVLLKALEAKVYTDICALLTLRDIMVLVCTLECVYSVTSLGERACESVAKVPGLIHTLMSLVTVEAQSYGPRACILMRVVETVSGGAAPPAAPPALAAATPAAPAAPATPVASHSEQQQVQQSQAQAASQPATPVKQQTERAQNQSQQNASPAPVTSIQQAHMQQKTVQENEQFALAWLRASYEPLPPSDNSGCDAADLYRQYMACCTKLNRKGVIAPAHFPRLVRTVFGGTVGPNTVTSSGETQQMYVGIRARNQPRTAQPAGPSSPILKAQLTNKSGNIDAKPAASQPQQTSTPHPHLSQALESGSSSNTSLIKHLLAHKVSAPTAHAQVAQRQQNQQRGSAGTSNTVLVQQGQTNMEMDPEAMIKCTTIIPGGVTSTTTPIEEQIAPKEESVQIQIDDPSQLMKSAQNKMLADLLEKKSNPPVQVVQMNASQINAPTIQITETGQILQVKHDNPILQFNAESGQIVAQGGPYLQVKNEAGQVIQLKNEAGQVIQLKPDQLSQFVVKDEQQMESVVIDHSYSGPPAKKMKEEKREESVSKTAANLYAALAASALEDEEDLVQQQQQQQQTVIQVHQPTLQVQQPTLQVQQPTIVQQMNQQTIQMQQPMLQVQPMDVQNILASQSGQLILQDKAMAPQQTQFVQQPMQIIATQGASQGGMTYLTQNIPGNMMQKTIIIVQGATSGGPITLTVNNPGGLDEATLNSVIAQATEAITQQQIIQNTPQLTQSQQPIITAQPQPHKAQLINTNQQQIVVTQKQPPALINTNAPNQLMTGQQVIQGSQQLLQGNQQIIAVSNNQQIIMNAPMKSVHRLPQQRSQVQTVQVHNESKTTVIQSTGVTGGQQKTAQPQLVRQVITRQPVMMGGQKIGEKETLVTQSISEVPQLVPTKTPHPKSVTPKPAVTPPPAAPASASASAPAPAPAPAAAPPGQEETPWICHWKGCGKTFENAALVFNHAARAHCPQGASDEASCMWLDCDRVPRKTFALLNHLNDRHCTVNALKTVFNSRRHINTEADTNKPVTLGYPPNAALAALNKHAQEFVNPRELMDENEGPVTKSIRLTAALILRNLVIYSNTGRRQLRNYEPHLATIALSTVEASRTIAQVLYDMNNI